jgi:uncharacterized spore protein YtfJ
MYTMSDNNVKSKWRIQGIEYSGIGTKPVFILMNEENEIKLLPLERGITNLRKLLDLEEI